MRLSLIARLVLLLMLCTGGDAHARTGAIARLEAVLSLNSDSSVLVIETIQPRNRSLEFEYSVPVEVQGPGGRRRLVVELIDVTDGGGRQLPHSQDAAREALRIKVQRPSGDGAVKITYSVQNAVLFGGSHDELYWQFGPWDAIIDDVAVTLLVPENAAGQFRAQGFLRFVTAGPRQRLWSSSGRVLVGSEVTSIRVRSPGPLVPGVALVLDTFLNQGLLRPPGLWLRWSWFLSANPVVLMPLVVLLIMLLLRRWKLVRDADRSIVPMYAPPEGLTPAEVGLLMDDKFDPQDVVATLTDLAVRGYVLIEESPLPDATPDFKLTLLKPREQWEGLAEHEYVMLFHTFYGGYWTRLSSLRLRFYDIVPLMRQQVVQLLRSKGMYRVDPARAQTPRTAMVVIAAGLMLLAHLAGLVSLFDSTGLGLVSFLLSAILVYLLGRGVTAKTRHGMRAFVAAIGFREFMHRVERGQVEEFGSEQFGKFLPYAIALGIEHNWATAFSGIATKPPEWYQFAGGLFDPVMVSNLLGSSMRPPDPTLLPRGQRSIAAGALAERNRQGLTAARPTP